MPNWAVVGPTQAHDLVAFHDVVVDLAVAVVPPDFVVVAQMPKTSFRSPIDYTNR